MQGYKYKKVEVISGEDDGALAVGLYDFLKKKKPEATIIDAKYWVESGRPVILNMDFNQKTVEYAVDEYNQQGAWETSFLRMKETVRKPLEIRLNGKTPADAIFYLRPDHRKKTVASSYLSIGHGYHRAAIGHWITRLINSEWLLNREFVKNWKAFTDGVEKKPAYITIDHFVKE